MSDHNEKSEEELFDWINNQGLMWKFKFYGFFKNLKFFEPYLFIIFIAWGLSLFEIGILIAIQQVFNFFFEVPSGMLADNRGKKNEMLICFLFYILSFFFYFLGPNFLMLVIASALFGLGEAFRSGTHKAMEMLWMEKKGVFEYKSYVYGTTRSYSLIGSSISSLVAIIFILNIPASRWIFIITIIPYIIDFFLIASYPRYMNESSENKSTYYKEFIESFKGLRILFQDKNLTRGILSTSTYDAIFKTIKDYIQPIMQILIIYLLVSLSVNSSHSQESFYLTVVLGIIYALFYLISSISSKKSYYVKQKFKSPKKAIDFIFYIFALLLLLQAIFIFFAAPILVIFFYLLIYVFYNLRRPIGVDYLGDVMEKEKRATLLSVETLLKSIMIIIFAPLFGFIADTYSITILFFVLAILMVFSNLVLLRGENPLTEEK